MGIGVSNGDVHSKQWQNVVVTLTNPDLFCRVARQQKHEHSDDADHDNRVYDVDLQHVITAPGFQNERCCWIHATAMTGSILR